MALVDYLVFIYIGTMFALIASAEEQVINLYKTKQDVEGTDYQKAYERLLNSIVKLNEKRIKAMVLLSDLQQTNVATKLRVGRESSEESESDDRPILLVVFNQKPKLRTTIDKNNDPSKNSVIIPDKKKDYDSVDDSDDGNEDSDDNDDDGMTIEDKNDDGSKMNRLPSINLSNDERNMLRKWRGSCDKKAARECRKACISASKNVCSTFKCKSKMKKKFKKECKTVCNEKFRSRSSSRSSKESD